MESVITKVSITEKGFSMEDSERLVQLGSRLKEARKRQRLTQAELAQKSGIAPSNISELEHGKTHIQLLTFIKIIEGLQVSADEIIRADTPVVHELYDIISYEYVFVNSKNRCAYVPGCPPFLS